VGTLALTLGLAALGTTPPAVALPAAPAAAPAPVPDDTTGPERPVRIEVGRFEPRTVTDGSTITVSGTLTNTGSLALSEIEIRLQRGEVLTTRAELVAADADEVPTTAVEGPFEPVEGTLAPGETLPFTYSLPADGFGLGEDGVYPVLVNVNATDTDGLRSRVGELGTYLIRRPSVPSERTTVAWMWPIVADSSRAASGEFTDDDLAEAVSPDGRLDRALAVIERLPRSTPDDDAEPVPALPVTLAVDPALVEELGIMAAGPYPVDGNADAGRGTEAAADFLERLRALAEVHPVVALPYGDVDVDALSASGLDDVITRSLPGTPEGTAEGPPGSDDAAATAPTGTTPPPTEPTGPTEPAEPTEGTGPEEDVTSSATPEATEDGAAEQEPGTDVTDLGAGARILAEALDVAPDTGLAWSAGGAFRADTVDTLQAGGVERLVLGPTGVTEGERAVGLLPGTAGAHTTVETPAGPLEVLVADAALGAVVSTAEERSGGPRLALQRYLAELALVGQQAADGSAPTMLIAPPREIDAGPDGAGAMMADTAGLPWLQPASVADLLATDARPAGTLTADAGAVLLDTEGLADVVAAEATRDDLAAAVVGDPDEALRSYDAATARTASVTHRNDAEEFRAAATDLRRTMGRLLERVTLLSPSDGTYSLASSDAPLVLTVQNDLPFAVSVLLDMRTRGIRGGIDIADIGPQELAPGERTTLQVPTEVRQSGGFTVTAALTTPGGAALGDPVRLQVKSTAYGTISLLITFGAAGLLGLLFLRRLVLFVVHRRRGAPEALGAEGGVPAVPPTRSPV
jgi:hypothetical protein